MNRSPHSLSRVHGLLIGCAAGDSLGLPYEGISRAKAQRRQAQQGLNQRICGRRCLSDDTEQLLLLGEAIARETSPERRVRSFRHALIGWVLRLPFAIGFGTLRAGLRLMVGLEGSSSAGNGAMMRAPILGLLSADDRRWLGPRIARLTHRDLRAVQAALFASELSAITLRATPQQCRISMVRAAQRVLPPGVIHDAVDAGLIRAEEPARDGQPTSAFSVESVECCVTCFVRDGDTPLGGIQAAIAEGGDTDTHAAIVGAWLGALHGAAALDGFPVTQLPGGPFGADHIATLAQSLATGGPPPRWSRARAMARNLSLYPFVLTHVLRRLAW